MQHQDKNLEIEVKFFLEDPTALRQKLLDCATLLEPKVFETNLRYDNEAHMLIKEDKLLRLRRDRDCRLTFKSKPNEQQRQFKIHHELEVSVSDYDTMDAILQQLGFKVVQIYEKWRETFGCTDALICIDTMPFGDFLEIEGSADGIRQVVEKLGLAWQDRILENYLSIFDMLRHKIGLPFTDITFKNFKNSPVDMAHYAHLLRIGR
jgi:adenylate cyclase class 2